MNKKLAILKRLLVAVSCIVLVSEGIVTKAEGSMTFDEEERKLSEEQQELEEKRKDLAQKMKDLAQKKKKEENRKKEEEKKQREAAKKRLEEEEKKRKEEEKKRKEEEKKNKAYSIVYQTMHKPAHVDNITIKIIEGYKVKVNVDAGTILGFFPSPFSRPFIAKESYSNTFDFTEEIELLRKNEDCNNIRDLILLVGKSFSSSKESIYSKEENKVRDTLAGLAESSLNRKQDQEIKNTKQNILFPKSITLSLGETAKYVKNLKPDTLRTYALRLYALMYLLSSNESTGRGQLINKILPIISEEEEKKTEEEKKRIEKEEKKIEEQEKKIEEQEKKIEEQEKKIEEQKKKLDEEKKRVEEEKKRIVQVTKKTNPNQVQKQNLISLNKVIGIMDGAVSGRKSEPSGGMK